MLAIRLQRTGRRGLVQYRVVVQDARLTPTSGRVVASVGNYDPHTKKTVVAKDKVEFYLQHGAQPSPRVVRLLSAEGIKMPAWVKAAAPKTKSIKNVEKLRKNRPAGAEAPPAKEPAAESEPDQPAAEAPSEVPVEPTEDAPAETEPTPPAEA